MDDCRNLIEAIQIDADFVLKRNLSSEHLYRLSVLVDALRTLFNPISSLRCSNGTRSMRWIEKRANEDLAWVLSDNETWPLSYVPVCEALGLDPDALRIRLASIGALEPWTYKRLTAGRIKKRQLVGQRVQLLSELHGRAKRSHAQEARSA